MADTTIPNPDDAMDSGDNELCAPLASLSVNGTEPAVGDQVEATVKGTVSRIEGDKAYFTPESVNDEPVAQMDNKPMPNDRAKMEQMSQEADNNSGY